MRYACLSIAVALLTAMTAAQPAAAVIQFYNVYKSEYLDTHPDQEYAAAVNKASDKCFVCHQGKNRKHHNEFGIHFVGLLDRKKDLKDEDKIKEVLEKVLAMHVNPQDDRSETYLDRVKASKWPGGELDDLKKEPPQEADAGN